MTETMVGAGAASVLWAAAGCLLVALIVQCCRTILDPPGTEYDDGLLDEDSRPSSWDLVVIACVHIALAAITLLSARSCCEPPLTRRRVSEAPVSANVSAPLDNMSQPNEEGKKGGRVACLV